MPGMLALFAGERVYRLTEILASRPLILLVSRVFDGNGKEERASDRSWVVERTTIAISLRWFLCNQRLESCVVG